MHAAGRHHPERHRQGVPVPRDLRLPARALAAADHRHDRLHGQPHPEVEPDQHLQLPPAGGRGDAGAGDRLRAVHGDRRARRRPRLRPGAARGLRRRRRPDLVLRQRRACASSRRCARCAPSSQLWDEITRERYGVEDAKQRRFRYGVQVNSPRPDRGAAGEQRPADRAGDARRHAVQGRPRPRRPAAGLERGARPAPALGPAVVAAHPAGAGLRVRPAGVRRHLRRVRGRRGQGRRAGRRAPAPRSTGCRRWAARWPPSSPAT